MEKIRCPFEATHIVAESRLSFHIASCGARAKVEHLFSQCIYNSNHWFKKALLDDHMKKCPDKSQITQEDNDNLMKAVAQQFNPKNMKKIGATSDDSEDKKKKRIRKKDFSTEKDWKTTYLNAKVEISAQKQNFSELMKSGPTTLFRTVDDKDKNISAIYTNSEYSELGESSMSQSFVEIHKEAEHSMVSMSSKRSRKSKKKKGQSYNDSREEHKEDFKSNNTSYATVYSQKQTTIQEQDQNFSIIDQASKDLNETNSRFDFGGEDFEADADF